MEKLVIHGGRPLHGHVRVSSAKNAVLPIIVATLLPSTPASIIDAPNLDDVSTICSVLESLGVKVTKEDNILYSKHKEIRGKGYLHYENYDAIDVPYTDAIPEDYEGVMGVPISFLDRYCPEQFEIIGIGLELANMDIIKKKLGKLNGGPRLYVERDGELVRLYERILIRKKQ